MNEPWTLVGQIVASATLFVGVWAAIWQTFFADPNSIPFDDDEDDYEMTAFTFTGTATAGTSAPAGALSGGVTPWFRLSERSAASSFTLTGTFTATIQLEYSNAPTFDKGTDYAIDDTAFTLPTLRALPLGIADYVRARCTAYTSGSPKLSFAQALDANGRPFKIGEDSKITSPPSSEAS